MGLTITFPRLYLDEYALYTLMGILVSVCGFFACKSLLNSQAILLLIYGFVVHPCGECSSRRDLIMTDNPY
jgi:hypothetical protein